MWGAGMTGSFTDAEIAWVKRHAEYEVAGQREHGWRLEAEKQCPIYWQDRARMAFVEGWIMALRAAHEVKTHDPA
jgi:hypothetical protein